MLQDFCKDKKLTKRQGLNHKLEEMEVLLRYCELYQILDSIVFDYYTGVIYEAVPCKDKVEVGSVAWEGRYNNLVGVFDLKSKCSLCVDMLLRIEQIFSVMENSTLYCQAGFENSKN